MDFSHFSLVLIAHCCLLVLEIGGMTSYYAAAATTTSSLAQSNGPIDIFNQEHIHGKNNNGTVNIIEGDIRTSWESISLLYSPEFARSIGLVPPTTEEKHQEKGQTEEVSSSSSLSFNNSNSNSTNQGKGTLSPVWTDYYWYNDWRPKTEIWRVDVYITPGIFNAEETRTIKKALKQVFKLTGVVKANFVKSRPTTTHFIEIIKDGGCWSYVGKPPTWTAQELSLGNGCVYNGIIQHEFLHALGFYHEHTRPDRDDYVTVNLQNVRDGYEYNFEKISSTEIDSLESPYDYKSIMHYGEYAFSVNGKKTVDTRGNDLGAMKKLSFQDRMQVRLMYQCSDGPRRLSQFKAERCNTSNCKCGFKMKGCKEDDNKCKGNLVCINNQCLKPNRRRTRVKKWKKQQILGP